MVNGSPDERVLSIFLAKSMAAIFYFNDSERLGIEKNLYQEGGQRSNMWRGVGVGDWRLRLPEVIEYVYFTKLRSSTNGIPDWYD